jgi:hypothetical protein
MKNAMKSLWVFFQQNPEPSTFHMGLPLFLVDGEPKTCNHSKTKLIVEEVTVTCEKTTLSCLDCGKVLDVLTECR